MSTASRRAKAALKRAMIKLRAATRGRWGRYVERVADIGVPLDYDQAEAIERTPDHLRDSARDMQMIATNVYALASSLDKPRRCPECGERIEGDAGLATVLRQLAAQLHALASEQRERAEALDDAADQIGQPGATLWYGSKRNSVIQ